MPNPRMNDPQGEAIGTALSQLGFGEVGAVRAGKSFDLTVTAKDKGHASTLAEAMCKKLLSNPVTETFEFTLQSR